MWLYTFSQKATVYRMSCLLVLFSVQNALGQQMKFQSSALPKVDGRIEITKTVIADDIYQFTVVSDGYVEQLNSIAVINDSDVLVYDTFTRPSCAAAVLQELRKITSKPVRYVVNSHWHPDHWSGNEVYAKAFPGLDIIASQDTIQFMRNAAPAWPARFTNILAQKKAEFDKALNSEKNTDGSVFTPDQRQRSELDLALYEDFVNESKQIKRTYPNIEFETKLSMRHGGRDFYFLTMVGDSESTTVLYLPKERILFTGDVVVYPIPYGTPKPSQRIRDLNRILNELNPKVIIPGHGPAMQDKTYLELLRDLTQSVVDQVRRALQNGAADLAQVHSMVNVEVYRTKFADNVPDGSRKFEGLVDALIRRSIREAREQDY
jgi:cyclase